MKKFIAMMLSLLLVLSLVACGNSTEETTESTTETTEATAESTTETTAEPTEELTEELTEEPSEETTGDLTASNNEFLDTGFEFYGVDADGATVPVEPFEEGIFLRDLYRDYPNEFPGGLYVREVTDAEDFKYQCGIDYAEGMKAYLSESMMGAGGHTLFMVIVPDGMDVETVRADIEANANPNKSLCHTAEKVAVVAAENKVLLVMSFEPLVDHLVASFQATMAG